MSGSLFLFLAIFGKVMLLRSVRGKLNLRIFMQKNTSLEYWGLFQGRLYLTILDKVEFEKSMSVEVFVGISAKKEKKKEKS